MAELKSFKQIGMPDFVNNDIDSLTSDIITKIKSNADWNALWDGELYQNSFQMIMQLFSYLFERNHDATNIRLRERFLNRALSEDAVYDNLADMHIALQQARSSSATLSATILDTVLSPGVSFIIPTGTQIVGKNINNESITFELIQKDPNTEKYNYFDNIIITPTVEMADHFNITAYAGTTFSYEYEIDQTMLENFIIDLVDGDIEEDSIRIWYKTSANTLVELPQTDTFVVTSDVDPNYFPNGKPHYILRYKADGSCSILFSSAEFGGAFDMTHVGKSIIIYGRKGAGLKTNILAGGIYYTASLTLNQGKIIKVLFTNLNDAAGGLDREDVWNAQVFAPYRYGRGKGIINPTDAQAALRSLLIKHYVDTPQYNEIDRTVPLLHNYHYCVPIRDFTNFILPDVESSDTESTYAAKFLTAINTFCNVGGTHDFAVTGEAVTDFVYPEIAGGATSFYYQPLNSYLLSGTLNAVAYDYDNRIVDSITWKTNYLADERANNLSYSATPSEHAALATNPFYTINITNDANAINDRLVFAFDEEIYPGCIFTVNFTHTNKTYQEFAAAIQTAIVAQIDANYTSQMGAIRDYQFVTTQAVSGTNTGYVILNSPSVGENSTITIKDNQPDINPFNSPLTLYTTLGFEQKIYRPSMETGLVFSTSTYRYSPNEMGLFFRNDRYAISEEKLLADLNITVNHSSITGPLVEIVLIDENDDQLSQLFENETLKVSFYNNTTPVDYIEFPNISTTSDTSGVYNDSIIPGGAIVKNVADNKYYYSSSKIALRLLDNTPTTMYEQQYPTIYQIVLVRATEDAGVWYDDPLFTPIIWYEENAEWTHDPAVKFGKTIELDLTTEQNNLLLHNENYLLKVYHKDENEIVSLKETFRFICTVEEPESPDPLILVSSSELVVDTLVSNYYTKTYKKIIFKVIDGAEPDPAQLYYEQSYADFTKVVLEYNRKTYENVVINYSPNPYYPEGEAAGIVSILKANGSRLIGLENMVKQLTFIPKGISVILTIKKNYSASAAITAVETLLYDYFGYNNYNEEYTIGSSLTFQKIKNEIGTIANEYGIIDIQFSGSDDITESYSTYYKFLLDSTVYDKLIALEEKYPAIAGVNTPYKITITATLESMIV